jgi:hypothetical protein
MRSPIHQITKSLITVPLVFVLLALVAAASAAAEQGAAKFRARLSTVPIDVAMQSTVAGNGSATAELTGNKLSVTGTFANLKSPATIARVHVGPKGIRGPALFDLQVTPGTSGSITGTADLTPAQLEDLKKNRFYIQLHSEKAPEGNLWGWLLPEKGRP